MFVTQPLHTCHPFYCYVSVTALLRFCDKSPFAGNSGSPPNPNLCSAQSPRFVRGSARVSSAHKTKYQIYSQKTLDMPSSIMLNCIVLSKDLVAASTVPLVLSVLGQGESYGYELIQRVRELSAGKIEWTEGMLYPVLHWMESEGQIESEWKTADSGRKRKYLPAEKSRPESFESGTGAVDDRSCNPCEIMEKNTHFDLNQRVGRMARSTAQNRRA